jgi:hypothetical protein
MLLVVSVLGLMPPASRVRRPTSASRLAAEAFIATLAVIALV